MVREEVLAHLLRHRGSYVSGEAMAAAGGVSRAAVWKAVSALRTEGYVIEASTRLGYRLQEAPDRLDPDLIRHGLSTEVIGRDIYCYDQVASTNAVAREMAGAKGDGTVVLAEVQSSGRGRMARGWQSPRGGIWMSLLLKPSLPPAHASRINMAVAVAVARAVGDLGLDVGIKWPNDLVIEDRKLCGILTEIEAEMDWIGYAVVGVGLNANVDPAAFPKDWKATSLCRELCEKVDRNGLVRRILEEADRSYAMLTTGFDQVYRRWVDLSRTLGRVVRITSLTDEFVGVATSLERDGSLTVELLDGSKRSVLAGDCVHLRPEGLTDH